MLAPLVFVSKLPDEDQKIWLKALREQMPNETILPYSELKDRHGVDVAIVCDPDVNELIQLPDLRWIQSLWAGVDQLVNIQALSAIPIVRMVDPQLAKVMAEAVLAWTLYLHRDMPTYAHQQREKIWKELPYVRAEQRVVGILGLGALGYEAASVLTRSGFSVLGWSRSEKEFEDFDILVGQEGLIEVLRRSDIIVCLLPLTNETQNLLDRNAFSKMKSGASLINFGRGGHVRIDDLVKALDAGQLSHAVLDVFNVEPLLETSVLWEHPKITILPHISAPTDIDTAAQIVAKNVKAYRSKGEIPVAVNRARGY